MVVLTQVKARASAGILVSTQKRLKTYIWCFLGASNFKEAMRMGAEIYQNLKSVVKKRYGIDGE